MIAIRDPVWHANGRFFEGLIASIDDETGTATVATVQGDIVDCVDLEKLRKYDAHPFSLVIPVPPKELHPNARVSWKKLAHIKKTFRDDTAWGAAARWRAHDPERKLKPFPRAWVRLGFFLSRKRKRDPTNLEGWMKVVWDGLQDAGIISDDDKLLVYPPSQEIDRTHPRVEIDMLLLK